MTSLSDEADKILVKIHLAHVLLGAQYDEINDIKNQHGTECTSCDFKHYQNQLAVLNEVVDINLTDEANKLERSLESYDQKHARLSKIRKSD